MFYTVNGATVKRWDRMPSPRPSRVGTRCSADHLPERVRRSIPCRQIEASPISGSWHGEREVARKRRGPAPSLFRKPSQLRRGEHSALPHTKGTPRSSSGLVSDRVGLRDQLEDRVVRKVQRPPSDQFAQGHVRRSSDHWPNPPQIALRCFFQVF